MKTMKSNFKFKLALRSEKGSTALEQALFAAAVILAASAAVPRFRSTMFQYLDRFSEEELEQESEIVINVK